MPAEPSVGDLLEGGYVFHVDTTSKIAYVSGGITILNYQFAEINIHRDGESFSNSDNLGQGLLNTNSIPFNSPAIDAIQTSLEQGYNDWYIPSIVELGILLNNLHDQNSNVANSDFLNIGNNSFIFWSSSLKDNDTIHEKMDVRSVEGSSASTINTSDLTNEHRIIPVRNYYYGNPIIVLDDCDGTQLGSNIGFINNIHFGQIVAAEIDLSIIQSIQYIVSSNVSLYVSFFIDINNLSGGFVNTPQSVFSTIPDLDFVEEMSTGKIYYVNSNDGTTNLNQLINKDVYHLTFNTRTSGFLNLQGDVISTPATTTIPSGVSYIGIPANNSFSLRDESFFNKANQALTTQILDLNTGAYWPAERNVNPNPLEFLLPGKAYMFTTTSSYILTFRAQQFNGAETNRLLINFTNPQDLQPLILNNSTRTISISRELINQAITESFIKSPHSNIATIYKTLINNFKASDSNVNNLFNSNYHGGSAVQLENQYLYTHLDLMGLTGNEVANNSSHVAYNRRDYKLQFNSKESDFKNSSLKLSLKFMSTTTKSHGGFSSFYSSIKKIKENYICPITIPSNNLGINLVIENGEKACKFKIANIHNFFVTNKYLNNTSFGVGKIQIPKMKENFTVAQILYTSTYTLP